LASGLLDTIYSNIYTIVIGKVFSASDLGYYTRAQQLESLPAANITAVLQRVTFPIFCSIQDDDARLIAAYRKLIRLASFVIFPLMFLLVAIAKPLVILLLTAKWLPAVDLFQILCFAGMWYPIHAINLNILQAKGRSDLFLRLELWKKLLVTMVLIITIPFGLKILVLGQAFTSFAGLFLNTYYTGKFFNYGIVEQLKDIFVFLLTAISLCGVTLFAIQSIDSHWVQIVVGILLYTGTYFMISKLFRFDELEEVLPALLVPLKAVFQKSKS
jgi:O-antigen/teichoic acid export membrane protein